MFYTNCELYDPLQILFDEVMSQQKTTVYDYWKKNRIECLFRSNLNKNEMHNNYTIFYPVTAPIQEGTILKMKNKVFLTLNQESAENTVYYRSDLIETNMTLETYANTKEIIIPCYASDITSTAPNQGGVISTVSGAIELLTQDNETSRAINIDSVFTALGGSYKVTNRYYKSSIAHIFVERTATTNTPTKYSMVLEAQPNYTVGKTTKLIAKASRTEGEVTNPTLEWVTSDENIASVSQDGTVTFKAKGNVLITAIWKEHNIPATATISVVEEAVKVCTIAGSDILKSGGSTRTWTATFYNKDGVADSSIAAVWNLELTPAQNGNVIITGTTASTISIRQTEEASVIGTKFNIVLTDSSGTYQCKKTVSCVSMWG